MTKWIECLLDFKSSSFHKKPHAVTLVSVRHSQEDMTHISVGKRDPVLSKVEGETDT